MTGTVIILHHLKQIQKGLLRVRTVCFAVARGSTTVLSVARLTATALPPAAAATIWGSAWYSSRSLVDAFPAYSFELRKVGQVSKPKKSEAKPKRSRVLTRFFEGLRILQIRLWRNFFFVFLSLPKALALGFFHHIPRRCHWVRVY